MEGDYLSDYIYAGNAYGNMYRVTNIGEDMTPQVSTLFSYENASGTERVVSQPLVVGNIVISTTFVPDENVCSGSGETYVFALDYKTGLSPLSPVIRLGGDEKFTDDDKVQIDAEKIIPVGKYAGRGRGSKPVVHGDVLIITTTDSGLYVDDETGEAGQQFFC